MTLVPPYLHTLRTGFTRHCLSRHQLRFRKFERLQMRCSLSNASAKFGVSILPNGCENAYHVNFSLIAGPVRSIPGMILHSNRAVLFAFGGFPWARLALPGRKAIPRLLASSSDFERPEHAPRSPAWTHVYMHRSARADPLRAPQPRAVSSQHPLPEEQKLAACSATKGRTQTYYQCMVTLCIAL